MTSHDVLARGGRVLWRAVRDEPKIFTLALCGSCLFGALVIAQAFVVGAIVGGPMAQAFGTDGEQGKLNTAVLAVSAAILIGMSLGRVVGILGRRLGSGFMMFAQQARYRRRVTRRYLELPLAWHQRHATGTLLSNANSDVEAAWFPLAPLPFAVGTVFMLVGAVGMLFATDWALALVGMVVFPLLFGLNVFFSRRMAPRAALAQQMRAEVSAIAHESFDGALVVKTMGGEGREAERFAQQSARLRDSMIRVGRLRGLFDPLVESVPFVGTLLALLVGALRMRQGAIDLADMVSVAFLFTVLAFPVRAIGWVLGDLPRSVAGWDRVARVLNARGQMPYGTASFAGGHRAPGTLRFSGVSFGYESAGAAGGMPAPGAADRQVVLHDISLTVPAGRTVALVGPTGSGKSTITSLAARLVDPDQGHITLDGVDLRELSQAVLTDAVAVAQQVAFVFDDTVQANVSLDRPGVTERDVYAALDIAQADGFVRRLADGLDTQLGERGTALSGGQKQRLALARALAAHPRLLILDDATSAVDPRIEARILASLRDRAEATSVLVVAYRLATIMLADEIIYLERGRVVAHGQHADLLAGVPGYRELVTAYERAEQERKREHAYDEEEVLAG